MDKQKNNAARSRRAFLSMFIPPKKETVKLLTADGKLVEVDKAVYEQAVKGNKARNSEILEWMDNPSTNNHSA